MSAYSKEKLQSKPAACIGSRIKGKPSEQIALIETVFTAFYLDLLVKTWEHYGNTFLPGKGYNRGI